MLSSASCPRKRRSRSSSTSCAASGPAKSRARFSIGRAAMEKRISRGQEDAGARRSACSIWPTPSSARDCRPCGARCTCCSTRDITARPPKRPCRADLCSEAIRLTMLLLESPTATSPETQALAALMCLHAARLPARLDAGGDLNPLIEQDRSRWDTQLDRRRGWRCSIAPPRGRSSAYHVEAAIAAAHATARSVDETDWDAIVGLYDRLMATAPSPVVALNRAIAIGQRDGPDEGLEALEAIADSDRLDRYPFYPAAIGELEFRRGNHDGARAHFIAAAGLARNDVERRFLARRLPGMRRGSVARSLSRSGLVHNLFTFGVYYSG